MADPIVVPNPILNAGAPYFTQIDPEGHQIGQRDDYFYAHVNAAGSATLTTGACHVAHIVVGSVATNPLTLTIFDNTTASGTVVSTLTIPVTTAPITITFNNLLNVGLSYTAAQTSGTFDLTLMWRNQS